MQETGKEAVTSLDHKLHNARRNPEIAELEALPLIPNGKTPASGSKSDRSSPNKADEGDQGDRGFEAEYDESEAYNLTPTVDKQTIEATEKEAKLVDEPPVKSDISDASMEEQNEDRYEWDDQLEYAAALASEVRKSDQSQQVVQKPLLQTIPDRRAIERSDIREAEPIVRTRTAALTETSVSSFEVTAPKSGSGKEMATAQARDLQNTLRQGTTPVERKDAHTDGAVPIKQSASDVVGSERAFVPSADAKRQVARPGASSQSNVVEIAVVTKMDKEKDGVVRTRAPVDEMPAPQQTALKQVKLAATPITVDPNTGPGAVTAAVQSTDAEPNLTSLFEAETAPLRDSRPATAAAPFTPSQAVLRPETPGMIGRQMVEALHRLPDRPVEITLNPSELGRVRMNISAAEAGIVVSLVVERPETADLIRRHINDLAAEFSDLGYENIEFSFSDDPDTPADREGDHSEPVVEISYSDPQKSVTSVAPEGTLVTGLDLRL